MIIGILAVSNYFICLLYGDIYITSSYVLKILSVLLIISPTGYLLGSRVMLIVGNEKQMVIPVAIGALVNIILNSILIKSYCEIGAAIASVISETIVMVVYISISKKHFKFEKITSTIVNIAYSSAFMGIYLYLFTFLKNNLINNCLAIIGSIAIYFAVLIIRKDEITCEYFWRIRNKLGGGKNEKKQ